MEPQQRTPDGNLLGILPDKGRQWYEVWKQRPAVRIRTDSWVHMRRWMGKIIKDCYNHMFMHICIAVYAGIHGCTPTDLQKILT